METMHPTEPTDADLVVRALAGNRAAFGTLYDRHARIVRAVVGGVSADWAGVEDMTQECFLRAYRKLDSLRDRTRFGAWVVGIARQVARQRKRALRRDRHRFVGNHVPDSHPTATHTNPIERNEELDVVMQELAALPERERLAIHAFFLSQRNSRQAAESLELSRSGFYALLQRAVARLAATLRSRSPVSRDAQRSVLPSQQIEDPPWRKETR